MTSVNTDISVADLATRLTGELEAVIGALAIVGKRVGGSFVGACPWNHPGKKAEPKLYIRLKNKRGSWIDFRSGDKGDALWLVAMTLTGGRRDRAALGEAVAGAKKRDGIGAADFYADKWAAQLKAEKARLAQAEADAAKQLEKDRGIAQSWWLKGRPLAPGQIGYRYLQARGIDFARLGRVPRAIRYQDDVPYYAGGKPIWTGPCLLTAMTLPDGKFGAVHRTWLDPVNIGEKADIGINPDTGKPYKPRKMWPETATCVMRLWRGSSQLAEREAVKHGLIEDVVVCEGVEDGLSLAMIAPERRVVAAGSLAGLLLMEPPACADAITIAADNDWGKPQAQAQLDAACQRFADEFGLTVKIARSPVGKDFNDLLRLGVSA